MKIGFAKESIELDKPEVQTWIFDPPYNIGFRYDNVNDSMDWLSYQTMIQEAARAMFEHTLEGGSMFMIHYKIPTARLMPVLESVGWKVHQWISWVYPHNMGMSKRRFTHGSRAILWLSKGEPKVNIKAVPGEYKNPNDKRIKERMAQGHFPALMDYWSINLRKNTSKGHRGYANQLPIELVRRCILTTSDEGDLIGDCMAGSGTTLEVAKMVKRRAWLNDVNPNCLDMWEELL